MRAASPPAPRAATVALALLAAALVAPGRAGAQSAPADSSREGGTPRAAPEEPPRQEAAPLVTDRPDFTESTASVAPGRVQVETGYTLSRRDGGDDHAVGEVLVRLGLASPLEARLAPGSYAVMDAPGGSVDGIQNPAVGAKATLLEPSPRPAAVPSVALLASTTLPAGHDAVSADGAEPAAALALGWTLGERASLGANLKHARLLDDGERFGRTVASAALGVDASGPLSAYAEFYTLRPDAPGAGDADVVNGGLTLLLGPDAQLDARVGAGLGRPAPDLILGVGFTGRL